MTRQYRSVHRMKSRMRGGIFSWISDKIRGHSPLSNVKNIWPTLSLNEQIFVYKNISANIKQIIPYADKRIIEKAIEDEKQTEEKVAANQLNMEWSKVNDLQQKAKLISMNLQETGTFLNRINDANVIQVSKHYKSFGVDVLHNIIKI